MRGRENGGLSEWTGVTREQGRLIGGDLICEERKSVNRKSGMTGWIRGRSTRGLQRALTRSLTRTRGDDALFLLALSILLFSTMDAIFTLLLVETGMVREWNPLLAPLVDADPQLFANVKSLVTHVGVFLLVLLVDRRLFKRIAVRRILEGIFLAYCFVILYHLSLMVRVSMAV